MGSRVVATVLSVIIKQLKGFVVTTEVGSCHVCRIVVEWMRDIFISYFIIIMSILYKHS